MSLDISDWLSFACLFTQLNCFHPCRRWGKKEKNTCPWCTLGFNCSKEKWRKMPQAPKNVINSLFFPYLFLRIYFLENKVLAFQSETLGLKSYLWHLLVVWSWVSLLTSLSLTSLVAESQGCCEAEIRKYGNLDHYINASSYYYNQLGALYKCPL